MNENDARWKAISRLEEPYNDAFNYRTREQKQFFNRLFLRTDELRRCLAPSTYFLMGEKGTGKTAYAIYLENNSFEDSRCQVITMTETQYRHFIDLKSRGKLDYSDYSRIWRSMLLYLAGRLIARRSKGFLASISKRFDKIESLLSKWEEQSLNPEIEVAFEAVREFESSGEVGKDGVAKASADYRSEDSERSSNTRHHLLSSENKLKEAIASLRLPADHVLFIDGIDYRPDGVSYKEYLDCVKGLGEAVWQLNTEFFGNIRDTQGRIKVVLLIRPDVFHALNLYNSNSRLQDNAVLLDWATTEREFKTSRLFEVSGRYFATQQDFPVKDADAWDHYYEVPNTDSSVFRGLLKTTFQKPRDILTFIKLTKGVASKTGSANLSVFPADIAREPAVTRQFSDYLLGEIRNYAAFYMTAADFENYMKFFQFLDGRSRFSTTDFVEAHGRFVEWAKGETIRAREFLRDPEAMLQLFYDVNLIGYSEAVSREGRGGETFFHWSYREKSLNNISPKVKTADVLLLNPGIAKALDVGKSLSAKPAPSSGSKSKRRGRRGGRGRNRNGA